MRSHVSLTRLTVDTGVSPENHQNWFGEFKTEVNSLYETPVPGTIFIEGEKRARLL